MKIEMRRILILLSIICVAMTAAGCLAGCSMESPEDILSGGSTVDVRAITVADIPEYDGKDYVELNNNIPYFTADDLTTEAYEHYGKLDSLGRCTQAMACLGTETIPPDGDERGEIYWIHPSGWKRDQGWERCHLIAWQLSDEDDNERNLITGTHRMNYDAMRPFEEEVGDYIRDTGNHVIYRTTPVYDGRNLIASGVIMEAISVEDSTVCFNVYCYNVEDYDADINYMSGKVTRIQNSSSSAEEDTFVLNTRTKKFHDPDCENLADTKDSNKRTVYNTTPEELEEKGYSPCQTCN